MTIALTSITVRHERRLRLGFSNLLAAGAFTSTAFYTVTSLDDGGAAPAVSAAIVVSGSPNFVELSLADDLAQDASFSIAAVAVPAVDASVTPPGSALTFRTGRPALQPNEELPGDDIRALIYGVDLVFDGSDYVETADGDLATVSGQANAEAAVQRRCMSDGLPWAPAYGAHPRRYVDGARGAIAELKGALVRETLNDDRVDACTVDIVDDDTHPERTTFVINATLKGAVAPTPVSVTLRTG